jgi:N-acetylglucosamine-6-phosphate deacetylase
MTLQALSGGRVLLDDRFVEGWIVLVEGGRIAAITRADDPRCRGARERDLGGGFLLPGFIDAQVNGGGGVLFNDAPTVDAIRAIGAAHRRFGTTAFLPTLVSDEAAVVAQAIAAVRAAIDARVPGVAGIHVEGPHISAKRRGVHDAGKIRPLDASAVADLTSLGAGRTLVTLAPETTAPPVIAELASAGVIVAAGHTDATYSQMVDALRAGVRGVTHLFNAMSPFGHREPGVAGAALAERECWCGVIADGRHVHPAALKIAFACKGAERLMLVTDAMPVVGSAERSFSLQGRTVSVRDGVCVDASGTLAGSALDMASAVRNAMRFLGIPLEVAARMASTTPAQFLRIDQEMGRIAAGYRANLVLVDADINVLDTWIDGNSARAP